MARQGGERTFAAIALRSASIASGPIDKFASLNNNDDVLLNKEAREA